MCKRTQVSCTRLQYPQRVFAPLPLSWKDKPHYMKKRLKQVPHPIHAFHFPYHATVPLSVQDVVKKVQGLTRFYVPNLHLFVTLKPPPNLRRRLHKCILDTLEGASTHCTPAPRTLVDVPLTGVLQNFFRQGTGGPRGFMK